MFSHAPSRGSPEPEPVLERSFKWTTHLKMHTDSEHIRAHSEHLEWPLMVFLATQRKKLAALQHHAKQSLSEFESEEAAKLFGGNSSFQAKFLTDLRSLADADLTVRSTVEPETRPLTAARCLHWSQLTGQGVALSPMHVHVHSR